MFHAVSLSFTGIMRQDHDERRRRRRWEKEEGSESIFTALIFLRFRHNKRLFYLQPKLAILLASQAIILVFWVVLLGCMSSNRIIIKNNKSYLSTYTHSQSVTLSHLHNNKIPVFYVLRWLQLLCTRFHHWLSAL